MQTRTLTKGHARATAILVVAALAATSPAAADCPFKQAVYTQPESSYVLRFAPSRELGRFPGTTNAFTIEGKDLKKPLTGWVIWNNGESRSEGSAMLDCPEEASSNEDFAACTHWEGVMYSLIGGDAILLPGEDEAPPAVILLPDFGRRLRYSLIGDIGTEEVPWDVFRFVRCGE
jgi:hypothetical protein